MSLGPGWIQRKILEALDVGDGCFLLDMVFYVFNTENPTKSQYNAVSRAVVKLKEDRYLVQKIFHWRTPLKNKVYGLNRIVTTNKIYESRKNHPKWSKQIFRIR